MNNHYFICEKFKKTFPSLLVPDARIFEFEAYGMTGQFVQEAPIGKEYTLAANFVLLKKILYLNLIIV